MKKTKTQIKNIAIRVDKDYFSVRWTEEYKTKEKHEENWKRNKDDKGLIFKRKKDLRKKVLELLA